MLPMHLWGPRPLKIQHLASKEGPDGLRAVVTPQSFSLPKGKPGTETTSQDVTKHLCFVFTEWAFLCLCGVKGLSSHPPLQKLTWVGLFREEEINNVPENADDGQIATNVDKMIHKLQ